VAEQRDTLEPLPASGAAAARHFGRRLGPLVVWLVAVAMAVGLYQRRAGPLHVVGYAERRTVALSAVDPRPVNALLARLHQPVQKNQILLALDDTLERQQLQIVDAEIAELRGQLSATRAQLDLDRGRDQMDARDLERRLLVDRSEAHVTYLEQLAINASDQMRLQGALIDFEVVAQLSDQEQASRLEFNRLDTLVKELRARLEGNTTVAAHKRDAFLESDRRWQDFRESTSAGWSYEPLLTPVKLAIEVKQKELESLAYRIERSTLRAPFDGQVTELTAAEGSSYQPGEPLMVVTAAGTNRIVTYVPENRLPGPAPGVAVRVRRPDSSEWFPGVVLSLADEVAEYPFRHRTRAGARQWGRALVLHTDIRPPALPDEAFDVNFLP
jgi:multidrug resistance efflux pump